MENKIFNKAFEYAVRGYSVMPIKADKRPLLASWKQYQTTAATEEHIETWWKKYPDALIGIITGKVSNITVVDIDAYKAGAAPLDKFPPTLTVRTGNGGYHLYYQYHPGLTISANAYKNLPGVDIRSDGGYVIAPPSVTSYAGKGGTYSVYRDLPIAPFPASLFPDSKKRSKKLSALIGTKKGSRNDSLASLAGTLLRSAKEEDWETEVWTSLVLTNNANTPPLPTHELRTTFESIAKAEKGRRDAMILSPIQLDNGDEIDVPLRKNGNGQPHKDMANAVLVLKHHPYYKNAIRFNRFRQEVEYRGLPLEDADIVKIQYFMQTDIGLSSINRDAVYSAITHYAQTNAYDEAQDWLKSLAWDGVPRIHTWISRATGVEDTAYHTGIGAQWFNGMVKRIMHPGSTFDYVLVFVGPQGIGKTSLFRILGGPWYKSFTGTIDNKDFYLALRGAMIVDLDEGSTLYKSEAIKIKSIITETHDEYRAPYDRVMKKYPRRFVFSMSTNDTEPFRDVTGNRRYWTIDGHTKVDFKWLEENRTQLFAEAYYYLEHNTPIPEVPYSDAIANQESHLPEDPWTDAVFDILQTEHLYCVGSKDFSVTIAEIYARMFPERDLSNLGRIQEMRLAVILKSKVGMIKKRVMIDGRQNNRWFLTDEKVDELALRNATSTKDEFDA